MERTYTVMELMEILHRSREGVKKLISSGLLVAFDSNPTGKTRKYLVTESALEAYKISQTVVPKKEKKRSQRLNAIKEFV